MFEVGKYYKRKDNKNNNEIFLCRYVGKYLSFFEVKNCAATLLKLDSITDLPDAINKFTRETKYEQTSEQTLSNSNFENYWKEVENIVAIFVWLRCKESGQVTFSVFRDTDPYVSVDSYKKRYDILKVEKLTWIN